MKVSAGALLLLAVVALTPEQSNGIGFQFSDIFDILRRIRDFDPQTIQLDSQGCQRVVTRFGHCNNSWADLTDDQLEEEEAALAERRAANPVTFNVALQQPTRLVNGNPLAQVAVDDLIDPEWTERFRTNFGYLNQLSQQARTTFGAVDSVAEYGNISRFYQNVFTRTGPAVHPAQYKPWVLRPQTDSNFTEDARWNDDAVFAATKLTSVDSSAIYRIGSRGLPLSRVRRFLNYDFDWDRAISRISGFSMRQAILRRRLFAHYHPAMENINSTARNAMGGRKFWSPFVVFVLRRREKLFRVVAIQLDTRSDAPVHSPTTSSYFWWTYAKLLSNNADALYATLSSHLQGCHFTGARMALSIQRELPQSHAVRRLLEHHFRGVHQTNSYADLFLVNVNGVFDLASSLGLIGSFKLIEQSYERWHARILNIEKDVTYRGVQRLPYYPYYQDGRRLYRIIWEYANYYVRLFYCCDDQVANDEALQRWVEYFATELHPDSGLPSEFTSIDQLVEFLTGVIWINTGYHASVSRPFADNLHTLVSPLNVFIPPDQVNETIAAAQTPENNDYLIAAAGPAAQAHTSANLVFSTNGFLLTNILDRSDNFQTGQTARLAKYLQNRLDRLEGKIDYENYKRTASGFLGYRFLRPSEVAGSVNI